MMAWLASGSLWRRSSSTLARVGHMMARSMPCSSMSASRGSGLKKASGERIGLPRISRRDLPSGLPFLKNSSWAPGAATTLNVGFGMYSEITFLIASLSRPLTWTYLITFLYSSAGSA